MDHGVQGGDPIGGVGMMGITMDGVLQATAIVVIAAVFLQIYRGTTAGRELPPAGPFPDPVRSNPVRSNPARSTPARSSPPPVRPPAAMDAADHNTDPSRPRAGDACATMIAAMTGPGLCTPPSDQPLRTDPSTSPQTRNEPWR